MATHFGFPDPTQGQSPVSFLPFLQEPRSTWPTQMDFERTHQSIRGFEGHSTQRPRSLSPQGNFARRRMTSGPEVDNVAVRPPPFIERDASMLRPVSREPAMLLHPVPRVPRRSPPAWGTSRYRQQQNQRYRRFNHLPPTLRFPEPSYDPRRQATHRDISQEPRRRSPDPRHHRNRPSSPLSTRWPSSGHDSLWHSSTLSNSRRYNPYPPPGHHRRRSSSDRRRYRSTERRTSSPAHYPRHEWDREPSSFHHRRQEFRERITPPAMPA